MKGNEIAALMDEPACQHNNKSKSGCSAPKPGATAGGCAFDGAQITLLPIADVAHVVHGPIGCAGSSWIIAAAAVRARNSSAWGSPPT